MFVADSELNQNGNVFQIYKIYLCELHDCAILCTALPYVSPQCHHNKITKSKKDSPNTNSGNDKSTFQK